MEFLANKLHIVHAGYKKLFLTAFCLCIAWLLFAFDGLSSTVQIWWGNEIFNHGFFILPGAVYLAYLKRGKWLSMPLASSWASLPFLILAIVLYVVGFAGDIQLFMHAAAFGLLPLIIWLTLGIQASRVLIFPFVFVLFAIPVGDQLIPWLQEVTADISVAILKLSGIPLFRSGLYIEIPQGRFLVAEACSGISFFIVSMVIGSFYAYLNFTSIKKQYAFFVLSVVYPIIANAIRVYGIILVGYWSDMEHAVGADHLIYGWVFFAFVLVSLLGIGEWMRDKDVEWSIPLPQHYTPTVQISKLLIGCAILAFILGFAWLRFIYAQQQTIAQAPASFAAVPHSFSESIHPERLDYRAEMRRVTQDIYFQGVGEQSEAIIYQAWFNGTTGELVSGLHRLYSEKRWSLIEQKNMPLIGLDKPLRVKVISDPLGNRRLLASWYLVQNKVFIEDTRTKLYQTGQALIGNGEAGLRIVVSVVVTESGSGEADAMAQLTTLVNQIM